jgi:hypothetical protein
MGIRYLIYYLYDQYHIWVNHNEIRRYLDTINMEDLEDRYHYKFIRYKFYINESNEI